MGFNIVLIARKQVKLSKVAKDLEVKYNIKTKVLLFDFNTEYSEYDIKQLETLLMQIDKVSILVNNVGVASKSKFGE